MTKVQRQFNGKGIVFSTSCSGKNCVHIQNKNIDRDHTSFTRINSNWITDLSIKCKIIKLLDENIGYNLGDPGFGDEFLDITPKSQFMKKILRGCPVSSVVKTLYFHCREHGFNHWSGN